MPEVEENEKNNAITCIFELLIADKKLLKSLQFSYTKANIYCYPTKDWYLYIF